MYLNVGSNEQHLDGFLNIDIEPIADVCCDVRWGLPFADAAFDGVFSEHFIEHIPPADAVAFLRECRRITRPGGRVRVATPDLTWLVERYQSEDWRHGDMFSHGFDWVTTRAEQLNIAMREWGHQWMYDEEELCRIGAIAGLELVGRCEPGVSVEPSFNGLETRPGSRLVIEFLHKRPDVRDDHPLVSILIPAYRADYLDDAIESARAQTWPAVEIIVGDDCPDDSVRRVVARHAAEDDRVQYRSNPLPRGARRNYYRLFHESSGAYVKYLNDDDVLHPRAVEQMAWCLNRLPRVTLVTSHRQRIAADGTPLPDDGATRRRVDTDSVIHGPSATTAMLATGINWIGEPTTTMFRRCDITDVEPELYAFGGRAAIENGDVTLWTRLLSRGDLCYLTASLSQFRQHDAQAQVADDFLPRALAAWTQIRFDATRLGLVSTSLRHLSRRDLQLRPWWSVETTDAVLAADFALERRDVDGALDALDGAVLVSGDDASLCVMFAQLARAAGSPDRAIDTLRRASVREPWSVSVRCELAVANAAAGEFTAAVEAIRDAERLAPGSQALLAAADEINRLVPASA